MRAFDAERPETWPLQFYDRGRLRDWPDDFLSRVAGQLGAVHEATMEVAFARLMVTAEMERRDPRSDRAPTSVS
jgi:hypothetical protein